MAHWNLSHDFFLENGLIQLSNMATRRIHFLAKILVHTQTPEKMKCKKASKKKRAGVALGTNEGGADFICLLLFGSLLES